MKSFTHLSNQDRIHFSLALDNVCFQLTCADRDQDLPKSVFGWRRGVVKIRRQSASLKIWMDPAVRSPFDTIPDSDEQMTKTSLMT